MPITIKQLRTQDWNCIYRYPGNKGGMSFETYSCNIKGITVTHSRRKNGDRVAILYRVGKRTTDSPTQAVRWWNEDERKQCGGHSPPGSVEALSSK